MEGVPQLTPDFFLDLRKRTMVINHLQSWDDLPSKGGGGKSNLMLECMGQFLKDYLENTVDGRYPAPFFIGFHRYIIGGTVWDF